MDPLGAMNFIPLAAAAATCVLKSRPGRGTSCTNMHKLENHVEGTNTQSCSERISIDIHGMLWKELMESVKKRH